jgi:hypothetical protein
MPETQSSAATIIDDSSPMPQGAPLREGEQKHASTLNLGQALIQESELDELRRLLAQAKGVATPHHAQESISEKKRRNMIKERVRDLQAATERRGDLWTGPCAPATVFNFNPVTLRLQGQLAGLSVAAAGRGKKAVFPYKGRSLVASYLTIALPSVWVVCIGTENDKGVDVPTFKADHITPLGIAHQFYSHYVVGARDAEGMGGILIIAGDAHTVDGVHQKRSNGTILVPVQDEELSEPGRMAYKTEKRSLDECLEQALLVQRGYAEFQISEGHRIANSPEELRGHNMTSNILWHNWAIEMGYKREPEKWAAAQLQDAPNVDAVFCAGCRQRQMSTEQVFCPNCNRPFDAYKAFMAGHPVPAQYLETYEGAEWEAIVGEARRRTAKRELLEGTEAPKKGKKAQQEE